MRALLLQALLLTGLLTGCGGDSSIEGSLSPLLGLRYQKTEAVADTNEAVVRFFNVRGQDEEGVPIEDTILKVTARLDKLELKSGQEVDLAELLGTAENSPQRGSVSRDVSNEPKRDFPRIFIGGLTFDTLPIKPEPAEGVPAKDLSVTGDFHVTFVNGTHVYSGRTLFGRFEATVP